MRNRQPKSLFGIILLCSILLLGGLITFSAYRADWYGLFRAQRSSYDDALVNMVSVSGGFTLAELNLSGAEMRKINFAALSHRETFPHVNLTLDPVSKRKPRSVKRMTPLKYSLVLKTSGQTEVHCWQRTVARRDFVPNMVDSLKRAAEEYLHIRDMPGRSRPLRRLYL